MSDPPVDMLRNMLSSMWRIRAFEQKSIELFQAGELPGFLHAQIGQEAVCVGTCAALRDDDYLTSTHRGHGDIIAKGGKLDRMFAELYAKETGYCRGKGGSMHIFDFGLGVLGANGIVGAGLPIATGAALSAHLRGTDQVAVSFFGDGATNEGAFHEALNIASVWKLPVVFVCQNNEYAESTPRRIQQNIQDVAARAIGYDIPGVVVDGMNVVEVYEVVNEAVERARRGDGPSLIEAKTYRFLGHYVGDPGLYRTKEEVEEAMSRDPLTNFELKLTTGGLLSEEECRAIEAAVRVEVDAAVEFGRTSPEPSESIAFEDVYA
jgi:TPP-dependent pyruvate/acetoin dehydrogenase alpha subunit